MGDNDDPFTRVNLLEGLACSSQVGPIQVSGPKVQVCPSVSDLGPLNQALDSALFGPVKSVGPGNSDTLAVVGPRRWQPKKQHNFRVATFDRWNDFTREKNSIPRPRKNVSGYVSDSEMMRDRVHGKFFMRRRREDQEAISPYRRELGLASDHGGVEIVMEEELGLLEDDGVSELEEGSLGESYSSSLEEGEIEPDDCLDGLAVIFGEENLLPTNLEAPAGSKAALLPLPPPPLDVIFPPAAEDSTPLALPNHLIAGSSKSTRVKGQFRELRNLEIEMSFGKTKESGLMHKYQ